MRSTSARPALLLILLLAGCGGAVEQDPARIRAGTDTVRRSLKYPETAQFKNVAASDGGTVCGEVNASMGMGRTGYERFVVDGGKVTLASQLKTDADMDALWAGKCR